AGSCGTVRKLSAPRASSAYSPLATRMTGSPATSDIPTTGSSTPTGRHVGPPAVGEDDGPVRRGGREPERHRLARLRVDGLDGVGSRGAPEVEPIEAG